MRALSSLSFPTINVVKRGATASPFTLSSTMVLIMCLVLPACTSFDGATEEVAFAGSDGTILQGTLVMPKNLVANAPAILLLHGAEPATRDRFIYALTANVFLELGFIVMVYDKRGAGESAGDYQSTTYSQLVDDALAALEVLKSDPRVHSGKIGILGVSESGWLTPEIAERSEDIAFVINKVGSALSVKETILWEIYNDTLAAGASDNSAAEQTTIFNRLFDYRLSPTAEAREELEEVLSQWADRGDSELPRTLDPGSTDANADLAYDPGPYLSRLATPFFYIYGTEDINIPTRESVQRLDELVQRGMPISYRVLEGEGHELGGISFLPPFYKFADGYVESITGFASAQVASE